MKHKNLIIKTIIAFSIVIVIVFTSTCCGGEAQAIKKIEESVPETFSVVENISLDRSVTSFIMVDNDTKVLYFVSISNGNRNTGSVTIYMLYDSTGSPKLLK